MKTILFLYILVILASCSADDDGGDLHTTDYYIKNTLSVDVSFIGFTKGDTVFNKTIKQEEELYFASGVSAMIPRIEENIKFVVSDSIMISINDSILYKTNNIASYTDTILEVNNSEFLSACGEDVATNWVYEDISQKHADCKFIVE